MHFLFSLRHAQRSDALTLKINYSYVLTILILVQSSTELKEWVPMNFHGLVGHWSTFCRAPHWEITRQTKYWNSRETEHKKLALWVTRFFTSGSSLHVGPKLSNVSNTLSGLSTKSFLPRFLIVGVPFSDREDRVTVLTLLTCEMTNYVRFFVFRDYHTELSKVCICAEGTRQTEKKTVRCGFCCGIIIWSIDRGNETKAENHGQRWMAPLNSPLTLTRLITWPGAQSRSNSHQMLHPLEARKASNSRSPCPTRAPIVELVTWNITFSCVATYDEKNNKKQRIAWAPTFVITIQLT